MDFSLPFISNENEPAAGDYSDYDDNDGDIDDDYDEQGSNTSFDAAFEDAFQTKFGLSQPQQELVGDEIEMKQDQTKLEKNRDVANANEDDHRRTPSIQGTIIQQQKQQLDNLMDDEMSSPKSVLQLPLPSNSVSFQHSKNNHTHDQHHTHNQHHHDLPTNASTSSPASAFPSISSPISSSSLTHSLQTQQQQSECINSSTSTNSTNTNMNMKTHQESLLSHSSIVHSHNSSSTTSNRSSIVENESFTRNHDHHVNSKTSTHDSSSSLTYSYNTIDEHEYQKQHHQHEHSYEHHHAQTLQQTIEITNPEITAESSYNQPSDPNTFNMNTYYTNHNMNKEQSQQHPPKDYIPYLPPFDFGHHEHNEHHEHHNQQQLEQEQQVQIEQTQKPVDMIMSRSSSINSCIDDNNTNTNMATNMNININTNTKTKTNSTTTQQFMITPKPFIHPKQVIDRCYSESEDESADECKNGDDRDRSDAHHDDYDFKKHEKDRTIHVSSEVGRNEGIHKIEFENVIDQNNNENEDHEEEYMQVQNVQNVQNLIDLEHIHPKEEEEETFDSVDQEHDTNSIMTSSSTIHQSNVVSSQSIGDHDMIMLNEGSNDNVMASSSSTNTTTSSIVNDFILPIIPTYHEEEEEEEYNNQRPDDIDIKVNNIEVISEDQYKHDNQLEHHQQNDVKSTINNNNEKLVGEDSIPPFAFSMAKSTITTTSSRNRNSSDELDCFERDQPSKIGLLQSCPETQMQTSTISFASNELEILQSSFLMSSMSEESDTFTNTEMKSSQQEQQHHQQQYQQQHKKLNSSSLNFSKLMKQADDKSIQITIPNKSEASGIESSNQNEKNYDTSSSVTFKPTNNTQSDNSCSHHIMTSLQESGVGATSHHSSPLIQSIIQRQQGRAITLRKMTNDSFELSVHLSSKVTVRDVVDVVANPDMLRFWCEPISALVVTDHKGGGGGRGSGVGNDVNKYTSGGQKEYIYPDVEDFEDDVIVPPAADMEDVGKKQNGNSLKLERPREQVCYLLLAFVLYTMLM